MNTPLQKFPRTLGLWGLAPQIICVGTALGDQELKWTSLALGYGYAALIFSFLGGLWWGLALMTPRAPGWIYVAAVAPSLIGLATYAPWIFGWSWPGPSLVTLGICLTASPLVDRTISKHIVLPLGWMQTRMLLSLGLGGLTLILATF
jgi:Protein of unknown function (DUF3429)